MVSLNASWQNGSNTFTLTSGGFALHNFNPLLSEVLQKKKKSSKMPSEMRGLQGEMQAAGGNAILSFSAQQDK